MCTYWVSLALEKFPSQWISSTLSTQLHFRERTEPEWHENIWTLSLDVQVCVSNEHVCGWDLLNYLREFHANLWNKNRTQLTHLQSLDAGADVDEIMRFFSGNKFGFIIVSKSQFKWKKSMKLELVIRHTSFNLWWSTLLQIYRILLFRYVELIVLCVINRIVWNVWWQ